MQKRSTKSHAQRLIKWLLALSILVIPALQLSAQQTGEVTGTVTDTSGAVIPGATITTTNLGTQQVRTIKTNGTGAYTIPFLQPGTYQVRVEKQGFKLMTRQGIVLQVGAVVRLNFSMPVGTVTQQVEVTTATPLLNTETTALGPVIDQKQVTQLPLNGRDYLSLVALSPNVEAEAAGGGGSGSGLEGGVRTTETISVAGQRQEFNNYTLDGLGNTDPNFNNYIIHPSIDAIEEFKVLTGVYSAAYGRGASQIDVTTRSGTNAYHGTAFEFIRNDYVDAASWKQVGAKNPFRRNQYGFVLSGPVTIPKVFNGRNRLFFMSNFEGDHDRLTQQLSGAMPTTLMREGNFSGLPAIYEPETRVYTSSTTGTATQFPGNQVPTSDFTPQSLAILKYFPLPTYDVGNALVQPSGLGNYVQQVRTPTDEVQFNQRIDWIENAKSSWFGRFSWESDDDTTASLVYFDQTVIPTVVRQAMLENTYVFSPTVVNQARIGWSQFNNTEEGYFASIGLNVQAGLGITGLTAPSPYAYGLASIALTGTGLSGVGGSNPYITRDQLFDGNDSLSIIRGKHTLTMGGGIGRDRYNQFGNQYGAGTLEFDGASTNDPGIGAKTGYAFADFLLGYPSQTIRTISLANAQLRHTTYDAFVQDDWKLTSKLTIDAGLRYENTRPWVDKHDFMVNVDMPGGSGVATGPWQGYGSTPTSTLVPGVAPVILTRPGTGDFYEGTSFRFASNTLCNQIGTCDSQQIQRGNQMGPGTVNPDNMNWGPRFGIAYSPTDKWSIRTGFGMYYVQDIGNSYFDMARSLGGKDQQIIASNDRNKIIASPWAQESDVNCPGFVGTCLTAPQIQNIYQYDRTPYVEQYMLNVERQLTPTLMVAVGYMGSESHHLDRVILFNQAVPKSGPADTSSILARTPFPAYGVFQTQASVGNAVYNAGSISVQQRTRRGITFGGSYTWARSIDDASSVRADGNAHFLPTNSYNLQAERGPSEFLVPSRFVANFLYQLPAGNGHHLFSHGIGNAIAGGWQVQGIVTLSAGQPTNYSRQGDTASIGNPEGNQVDYTGVSPIPAHRSAANFWNIAAASYTNPDLTWRMGSMGQDTLTTPGYADFDSSLIKNFHIWESQNLQFRFEAFNTLNHPNWVTPSSNVASPTTFGVVNSAKDMRQLQAALKYSF